MCFHRENKKKIRNAIIMKHSSLVKMFGGLGIGLALLGTTAKADDHRVIYTMDNAAAANHVLVFQLEDDGQLASLGSVETGGTGTGAGLSDQGSIVVSHDGRWLFVCNAGSDDISVFSTANHHLQLVDKVNSGGQMPLSLALQHNLLYVLNAGGLVGGTDNITGFLFVDGQLVALPGSTRALSGTNTGPAQVAFTRDGNTLIVTERLSNLIDTFTIGDDDRPGVHQTSSSSGADPFGLAVGRQDHIFVSEATASTASSYSVSDDGTLGVISASVPTEQQAACWLTLTPDERFAYTANAASGTLSGFTVAPDGSLHLLEANGIAAVIGSGSHPVDMAPSADGRFLFSLANGNGTLNAFRVKEDGSLEPLGVANNIPASAAGLAVQ
jgi:6-phosphogluconolactonase (cycloisomerase 2 family)